MKKKELDLMYITLLKYGEFSWYSQFGFKPLVDEQSNSVYEQIYADKSTEIKGLTVEKVINVMETFKDKYQPLACMCNCHGLFL